MLHVIRPLRTNIFDRADDILASSHKGPVMVYMASASGGGWTKLCQEGLSGGTWATDRLISNKGYVLGIILTL